jgi:hypothetical protein
VVECQPPDDEGDGMKVQIKVTVEVDPTEWAEEFGCERREVREDVRRYFAQHIDGASAVEDASLTVRVA